MWLTPEGYEIQPKYLWGMIKCVFYLIQHIFNSTHFVFSFHFWYILYIYIYTYIYIHISNIYLYIQYIYICVCVCVCVFVCLSVYKFMCVLKKIRLMNTQLECLLIANFLYVFCVTTCWRKYAKIFWHFL